MTFLFAIVLFGLAAYCASKIYDGFKTGEMEIIDRSIVPMFMFRKYEPILFWIATVFNGFLFACTAGSGAILLIQGFRK